MHEQAPVAFQFAHLISIGQAAVFQLHPAIDTGREKIVQTIDELQRSSLITFVADFDFSNKAIVIREHPAITHAQAQLFVNLIEHQLIAQSTLQETSFDRHQLRNRWAKRIPKLTFGGNRSPGSGVIPVIDNLIDGVVGKESGFRRAPSRTRSAIATTEKPLLPRADDIKKERIKRLHPINHHIFPPRFHNPLIGRRKVCLGNYSVRRFHLCRRHHSSLYLNHQDQRSR